MQEDVSSWEGGGTWHNCTHSVHEIFRPHSVFIKQCPPMTTDNAIKLVDQFFFSCSGEESNGMSNQEVILVKHYSYWLIRFRNMTHKQVWTCQRTVSPVPPPHLIRGACVPLAPLLLSPIYYDDWRIISSLDGLINLIFICLAYSKCCRFVITSMATDRATAALVPIEVCCRLQMKQREIKVIANTVPPTLVDTIHFLSPLKLVLPQLTR